MARPSLSGMTIAKLENILANQRNKRKELVKQRTKLEREIEKIDRQIAGIDGGMGGTTAGGRARNTRSLVDVLEQVLQKKPDGMGIEEIKNAVTAAGYKSSSASFRGIINQTLLKEKGKFKKVSRGVYTVKK